jgi:hypothetical protein
MTTMLTATRQYLVCDTASIPKPDLVPVCRKKRLKGPPRGGSAAKSKRDAVLSTVSAKKNGIERPNSKNRPGVHGNRVALPPKSGAGVTRTAT